MKQHITVFKVTQVKKLSEQGVGENFVAGFYLCVSSGEHGFNCTMLMYSYHILKLLYFGHSLMIFLILTPFWLIEMGRKNRGLSGIL